MLDSIDQDQGINILIVDDDPDDLERTKLFLEKESKKFNINTDYSPKSALQNFDEYDIIVSDYQMPGMDGLEFLEVVREERDDDIPFIIFTGKGQEEVAMEALNLGADRYLQKGGSTKSQYGVLAEAILQEVKHVRDLREKEKVEAELSSLVKGSDDPIYIVDENCKIVFANQAKLEKTGMSLKEINGSKFRESHPKKDPRTFKKKVRKALETGKPQRQEIKHEKTEKYYYRTISPIKNHRTGEVDKVSVISKDITKRKTQEKKMKEIKERFRKLFENVPEYCYMVSPEGEIIEINESALDTLGYRREEIKGKPLLSTLYAPYSKEKARKLFDEWEKGKEIKDEELEILTKNGEKRTVLLSAVHVKDGQGEVRYSVSTQRDITERKKAEKEAKRKQAKYRSLFENSPVGIWEEDFSELKNYLDKLKRDKNDLKSYFEENPEEVQKCLNMIELIDVNEYALEFYNANTKEELINNFEQIFTSKSIKIFKEELLAIANDKNYYKSEIETKTLDGKKKYILFELRVPEKYQDDYSKVYVTNIDIFERKEMEKVLRDVRARMSTLLSTIPSYVYLKDEDLNFVTANESLCNMLGVSKEEIEGKDDYDFFPEEYAEEYQSDDRKVVETGEPVTNRIEKLPKDNGDLRWMLTNKSPIKDDEGNVIGLVGQTMDITKRIKSEERKEFLYSLLRHDVKNKALVIRDYVNLIQKRDPLEKKGVLNKMGTAIENQLNIIDKVSDLEKLEEKEELKTINATKLLKNVMKEKQDQASEKGIQIINNSPKESWKVKGGELLKELFDNLISNSIKHSNGNKIRIKGKEKDSKIYYRR